MARKFYLTTPIYYVNDQPHIGHTYTTVVADVIARFHRMLGQDVHFLTGTDEHGQKIERAAQAKGLRPIELADGVVERFLGLWRTLGITNDAFIRTTEERHRRGVEKLYQKIAAAGDIYKDKYAGWYCTSCEAFYPENQVVDGRCPDQGHKVEWTEEESYFFRLSKYQEPLLKHYAEHRDFVFPESRRNEVVSFVQSGLKDLSISRSSLAWGIPLPDDPKHVFYVWFDALSNYITALGYGADRKLYARFWPADIHLVGKDILRFHAVYWPAFLMSADEPLPRRIVAHGWWLRDALKISKSRGGAVDPIKVAARDAWSGYVKSFEHLDFSGGLAHVWELIGLLNRFIVQNEPWKLAQDEGRRWALDSVLYTVVEGLRIVAVLIAPVMPGSAMEIWKRLGVKGEVTSASLEHFSWGELKPDVPITR